MVSRVLYPLKNEGKKNRDLTFSSSMSRFHYGLKNNFIVMNFNIYLSSIYHDNIELFLRAQEELEISTTERIIYDTAKYNARKIFTFLAEKYDPNDYAYVTHVVGVVVEHSHFDLMKTLLEGNRFKQIKTNNSDSYAIGRLPYSAALSGNTDIFDYVVNAIFEGDNIKLQDYKENRGSSLCFECINHGLYHMFEHLRNKGYIYSEDIIDQAALNGKLDCLIKLHEAGFAITSSTLQSATINEHDDVIEYIIRNAEEIENNDDSWDTMTSLMFRGKLELVKMLANRGVSVDAHYTVKARQQGHMDLVRWVIQEHPDVYLSVAHILFDFVIEEDQN
jgi:hypothetical protein